MPHGESWRIPDAYSPNGIHTVDLAHSPSAIHCASDICVRAPSYRSESTLNTTHVFSVDSLPTRRSILKFTVMVMLKTQPAVAGLLLHFALIFQRCLLGKQFVLKHLRQNAMLMPHQVLTRPVLPVLG